MNVTLQMVEDLNRRSSSLNSKRQQQIGMYEASRQAYEKAVMGYKAKYGVIVDDTNIQQEYNNVKAQLESDYNDLNSQIISIETGEYKKTMQPVQQPQQPQQVQPDTVQNQVQQMTAPNQAGQTNIQPPTGDTGVVNQHNIAGRGTVAITPEMLNAKATPVAVPAELKGDDSDACSNMGGFTPPQGQPNGGIAQFSLNPSVSPTPQTQVQQIQQPQTPTQQNLNDEDDDEVITVQGWGTSTTGKMDINANFGSILGQGK